MALLQEIVEKVRSVLVWARSRPLFSVHQIFNSYSGTRNNT